MHLQLLPSLLLLLGEADFFLFLAPLFLLSESDFFEPLLFLCFDASFFLAVEVESVSPPFVDDDLLIVLLTSSESLIALNYIQNRVINHLSRPPLTTRRQLKMLRRSKGMDLDLYKGG